MQLDEFKRELENLASRIDDDLAQQLAEANDPFGSAWAVDVLFPRDKSGLPEKGARLVIGITAHFAPVGFRYEKAPP